MGILTNPGGIGKALRPATPEGQPRMTTRLHAQGGVRRLTLRALMLAACCAAVIGCAAVPEPAGDVAPEQDPGPTLRLEGVDRPVLPGWEPDARTEAIRYVLAAEIAVHRGNFSGALTHYSEAMSITRDPRVAERAVRLAVLMDDRIAAQDAATRWRDLAPDHPEVHQLLGVLALRGGDAETAHEHFSRFLERWHGDAGDAFSQIGLLIRDGLTGPAAVEAMERLAEEHADIAQAHVVLARTALGANMPEKALEAADRAASLEPGRRDARMIGVQALINAERPGEAARRVEELLERSEADRSLKRTLGQLLFQAGEDESALRIFRELLEETPDDPDVLHAAAMLAEEQGDLDDAERWLLRLLEHGEHADAARLRLARLAEERGDMDEARRYYAEVGSEYRFDARLRKALITGEEGELDEALQELKELREAHPGEEASIAAVEGHLLRFHRRLEASVEAYDRGLDRVPDEKDLLYGRGLSRAELGDVDGAEEDFRRVLELAPDDAHALNALGYTLADAGRKLEEARELIERALEQEPDSAPILDSMGWVLYRLGQPQEALEYLERAFEKSGDAEIGAHLGEVLWELGRRDEARAVWDEAAEGDPDHPVLRETLERLGP